MRRPLPFQQCPTFTEQKMNESAKRYRVNEIFHSIEGEGARAGLPATFVRLVGCNLRCSYCDTTYAFEPGPTDELLTADEIAARAAGFGARAVTVTGGEPLLQDLGPLFDALDAFEVNVETNGSIELPAPRPHVFYTMDWKSPSSGEEARMRADNLARLTESDVLKFVVGTEADLRAAEAVLAAYKPAAQVFFSPVFGQIPLVEIADFLVERNLNARLQVQLHKIVWDPDARGV